MLISENREEEFENLIYEIEEDRDNKVYQMTDFLNYLKNFSFVSDENTQDDTLLSSVRIICICRSGNCVCISE